MTHDGNTEAEIKTRINKTRGACEEHLEDENDQHGNKDTHNYARATY